MDPVTLARLWLAIRPIRLLRNRRRAKRGLPPLEDDTMPDVSTVTMSDGRQIQKTEPIINARSSTKSGTLGLASIPVLQLLQTIPWPWPWAETLVMSPAFAQIVTIVMMYVTARYTKTPSDGGAI
jgi:hypothetical protein